MKLIIFDVDGTLLYTLKSISYYVNKALEEYGYEKLAIDLYEKHLGYGSRYLIKNILRELDVEGDDINKKVYDTYHDFYANAPSYLTDYYPGIKDLIRDLSKENKLLALSNKPDLILRPLMEDMFPDGEFSFFQGQIDGYPKKPDPKVVLDLIEKYGFNKEDTYFIGDSEVDIKTGKNAGVKTIAVSWGFRDKKILEEERPDFLFDSVEKLREFLIQTK